LLERLELRTRYKRARAKDNEKIINIVTRQRRAPNMWNNKFRYLTRQFTTSPPDSYRDHQFLSGIRHLASGSLECPLIKDNITKIQIYRVRISTLIIVIYPNADGTEKHIIDNGGGIK